MIVKRYLLKKFQILNLFYFSSILATFIIFLCSIAFIFSDYYNFRNDVEVTIKEQNQRARTQFVESFVYTRYLSESISKQILINHSRKNRPVDYDFISNLLIGYHSSANEIISWSTFSWVDKDQNLRVSGNFGIMKSPSNLSHRDYINSAQQHPRQAHIGKPVFGIVSNLWSIPTGYGVVDERGNYLGVVVASIAVDGLKNRILNSINNKNVAFAILDGSGDIVTKSENFDLKKAEKFFNKLKESEFKNEFKYDDGFYHKIDNYPYAVVTFYNLGTLQQKTTTRLTIYTIIASLVVFFVHFLFSFFYRNLLEPLFELSLMAEKISRGEKVSHPVPKFTINEINELAKLVEEAAKKSNNHK